MGADTRDIGLGVVIFHSWRATLRKWPYACVSSFSTAVVCAR
jgi:hypothetical protein